MGTQGLDERDNLGCTALHCAAQEGHKKVLKLLLLAGADPMIANNEGRTPRRVAKEMRYRECVKVFEVSQKIRGLFRQRRMYVYAKEYG
jgi:ankyrin repeat protein